MSLRLIIITACVVLVCVIYAYVYRRMVGAFALKKRARWLLATGFVLAGATFFFVRWLPSYATIGVIGNTLLLGILLSGALMLLFDVFFLLQKFIVRILKKSAPAQTEPTKKPNKEPTRRTFLKTAATSTALTVGVGSSVYGSVFGRYDYQIETVPVRLPGLSPRLEGYTLVQLSDIHFGAYVGEAEMRSAVALVKSANPDAIVLTGDLVDHNPAFAHHISTLVHQLRPLARDGVFMIPGNHDHWTGIEEVLRAVQKGGATILNNQGVVLGNNLGDNQAHGFALLGVDDLWARRGNPNGGPDLARAIADVPKDLPRVLLAHNPAYFPEAADHVQLQLSGHTHGGQVSLGFNPAQLVLPYGYVAGVYKRGESQLYVNRGFGTAGPPSRIGAPPEVTKIVLLAG